jgi:starvation-inducible outer membrane lipoprotein
MLKSAFVVVSVVTLSACSSAPPKIDGFDKLEYIQRQEVIHAAKECVNARMKPSIQYVRQKTPHGIVMLPSIVTCEPAYNMVR